MKSEKCATKEYEEKIKAYRRAFYIKNQEKLRAYSREYNRLHSEERKAYNKAYYQRKKAEDPYYIKKINARKKKELKPKKVITNEDRYARYVSQCKKTLNEYLYNSMKRDKERNGAQIQHYFIQYPFEQFGERAIKQKLKHFGICKNKAMYDDCYDAGVMAYMYSIHRCGASGYDYFIPYLYKMIRIYIMCALIIYNDSYNICRINNMKQICINKEENMQRY
ncbi:MAG: hypothetical protein IKB93_02905 [Clostridia bacterium]|nr:hypothetical protein [Clostridia bacterium]